MTCHLISIRIGIIYPLGYIDILYPYIHKDILISIRIHLISIRHLISSRIVVVKSLQSCSTLCDPIDGSPPGSAVPGILQARTLEWVAISFSNA